MKTFKQFISETSKSCNKTKEGTHCPVHGNKSCYLNAVKELEEGLKKLNNISYDSIDKLMRNIMKENDITAKQLHNAFVDIHHKTPDDWIKELNEETKSGDGGLHDWFNKSKSSSGEKGWVQLGGKWSGKPCARQVGQTSTPKCGSSKMKRNLTAKEEEAARRRKNRLDPNQPEKSGGEKPTNVRTEEIDLQEVKDKPGKGSGKKDACYHKVKSRFKVWPSAYASGALVKCRKVGADNWGTKSEAVNLAQQAAIAISMKKKGKKPKSEVKESCWSGYTQKGLKKKDKKIVPNCVPVEEEYTRIQTRGTTYTIVLNWRGKTLMKQMFFPQFTRPSKLEVTTEVRKIYPNALVLSFYPSMRDPTQPLLFSGEKL